MLRIPAFFGLILMSFFGFSQEEEVVVWSATYSAHEKNIEIKAGIKDGWHLYSQHVDPNAGPIPTSFHFTNPKEIKLIGSVKESEPVVEYDKNFGGEVAFFEHEVVFNQRAVLKSNQSQTVSVTYMVCNDSMCLPPEDKVITITNKEN